MLKDVFQVYLNRLIDLSSRNRAVFLPKLITSQMVDLKEFHFLNNHPSFFYITELLGRKRNIPLIQFADARDKGVNQLSQRLKRLQQNVRLAEQETGERSLFVGWPFVAGKLVNDQVVRCPLVLFPVSLVKEDNRWFLRKRTGAQPILNSAFLLAYVRATGIKLDKDWLDTPLEDFPREPTEFRTALYHYLNQALVLNFNQELLEDKLDFFEETNKKEEERNQKTGILKLKPFAVLGQFSQKSSFLIDDYERLKEKGHESLEDFFSEWFEKGHEQNPISGEESLLHTFPIDASQEEVMRAVRAGESCVVEGPPGSGKSQLICNLVTDFASRGKRVLVVSQKRAALDVVFKRLSGQGLGPFVSLVHDFRADRKELLKKISHQINSLNTYEELNRGLDAIQLERSFNQTKSIVEKHTDYLEDYKEALFDRKECGVPIKELYITSFLQDEHFDLTQYYKKYRFTEIDNFLRDFREYRIYYKKYQHPASFWLHRIDFTKLGSQNLPRFQKIFEEIGEFKEMGLDSLQGLAGQQLEFRQFYQLYEYKEKVLELSQLINQEEVFNKLKNLVGLEVADFDVLWLENKIDTIKRLLAGEGIAWTVGDGEVEGSLVKVLRVLKLKGSWRKDIVLRFNRKSYRQVWELLKENQLRDDKEGIASLATKLENRLNINHQYTLLQAKDWISLPEKPFDLDEIDHFGTVHLDAIKARFLVEELEIIWEYLLAKEVDFNGFSGLIAGIFECFERLDAYMVDWRKLLTPVQLNHLLAGADDEKIATLGQSMTLDFVELVAFDKLRKRLRKVDLELMSKMIDKYPRADYDYLKQLFIAGLKLSWIGHIEAKYPVLQEVGTPRVKSVLDEFSLNVQERLKISRFMAELKLREKTYQNLEYNRLKNRVTYRELSHQVDKKKHIWPVKKLIGEFEEEVFRLVPCWLASPETVAALFPLKQTFDLVVFDESSQCFVERGLPALLRGKQVVVAGDSQQLQPYDLYQARLQEEDEGMEVETDSLLDLSAGYFKKYALESHYRSKSLPLIHFSNKHFYDNALSMLPDRHWLNRGEVPFELVKVAGVWDKQLNEVEAESVIVQLKGILERAPQAEIGVITFNYYQMELILALMEKEQELAGVKNIQVKNIENMQGDEFDIVVFSIGYAKNRQGRMITNFGLLAKVGGGNRLNVAITRAREKIVLVTSISSADFGENHLKNPGIRLLRDYLRYVEDIVDGAAVVIETEKPKEFQVSWYLKNKLIGTYKEHEVRTNTLSKAMDLELLESGLYSTGILTDDDRFYQAKTMKEAFVYHPQLLRSKNWNVIHIFSRQYWLDREDLLQTKLTDEDSVD